MSRLLLAIDAGNTRIKWGMHDSSLSGDKAWRHLGNVSNADIVTLDEQWRTAPTPERVVISNVAGEPTRRALEAALHRWPHGEHNVRWLNASRAEFGISNLYERPEQLGSDRWAALIGAWQRHCGESLVVNCGTATTVDRLSSDGVFRGGLIAPGVELMKRSLMEHTAKLGLYTGRFQAEPRNTADAIESGCLHAQAGMIERMWRHAGTETRCFITGGAAEQMIPLLTETIPSCIHVEHLTLEGLVATTR